MGNLASFLSGLFMFLPFFGMGIFQTDLKPYYLLILAITYFIIPIRIPQHLRMSLIIFFTSSFIISWIGAVLGKQYYLVLFCYQCIFILTLERGYAFFASRNKNAFLLGIFYSWVIGVVLALLQVLNLDFLTSNLLSTRSSNGRGVTGYAPEPSTFGLIFTVHTALLYFSNTRYSSKLLLLVAIVVLFLIKSASMVLALFIWMVISIVLKPNLRKVLFSLSMIGAIVLFVQISPDSRLSYLIKFVEENSVRSLIYTDASVLDRAAHASTMLAVVFPPLGLFMEFEDYVRIFVENDYMYLVSISWKIMSGLGGQLFFFGPIWLLVWYVIYTSAGKYGSIGLQSILVFSVLTQAIPIHYPIIGVYLASLLIHRNVSDVY